MFLGYNTNGLAHHDPLDAIALLADLGYRGLGLTIDHGLCSPRDPNWRTQAGTLRQSLSQYKFHSVVETGARFLLDARLKHEPTLVSRTAEARVRRVQFLQHAIDVAVELGSDAVSFWSGIVRDAAPEQVAWERLSEGLKPVIDYAAQHSVTLAFEPEPGMFIDTMARFGELIQHLDAPHFQLTIDVGHLHCQGELPIADYLRQWGARLANVHLEDMRAGVHEHLQFGVGEIDFPPVIDALRAVGYQHGVYVELSRHSHDGPAAARTARDFLRQLGL